MANSPTMTAQQQAAIAAQQAAAQNMAARKAILASAIMMKQQIYTKTSTLAADPVLRVSPRFVGLGIGFWLQVDATFSNTGSTAAVLTSSFGPANVVDTIQFNDLNNQIRIMAKGWQIELTNTVKSKRIYGSSLVQTTGEDSPVPYGSNYNVITATPSIAGAGTGTVRMIYWIPLAYTDTDLRGSIWLGVNNATAQLQITMNQTPWAVNTGDTTNAVYTGAGTSAATMTGYTVTVTQVYYDQVPYGTGGPLLPATDIGTAYQLLWTNFSNVTPNIDFPMQYTNYRQFLSTFAIYNNNGTTGRSVSDVASWSLQSANFTNIWKLPDSLIALQTRNIIGSDVPVGVRYFSSRGKPIATNQYGNMELVLNATTASAGNYVNIAYEFFTMIQTITQAGSLAAN